MEPRVLSRMSSLKKCMGWPIGALAGQASTYAPPQSPPEGTIFVDDVPPLNYPLPQASSNPFNIPIPTSLLREIFVKPILEDRPLIAGILLALLIVVTVSYTRSPWRKLPPSPRRTPIIGNALQLLDINWLISKDCKNSFGEYLLFRQGNANTQPPGP